MKESFKNHTIFFKNSPRIIGHYSLVGKKESEGNFKEYFDEVLNDDLIREKSYESAERKMLQRAIDKATISANLKYEQIDAVVLGDLLNQITSSSFSARELPSAFIGVYGACSTMAESLIIGSMLIDGSYMENVACGTCSHFSSSEKQYRFPLELGNQRPIMAQWTVTGAGVSILSKADTGIKITCATFGKVEDYGVKDANNMGAAMAPAAMSTLIAHFDNTNTIPKDYDLILTGDLGKLGSDILRDLMEKSPYKLGENYSDCGAMIYSKRQHTMQGGSGAGASASVLNSYVIKKMEKGEFKKVLFVATGALLSPLTTLQGESIPAVAHAVVLEI